MTLVLSMWLIAFIDKAHHKLLALTWRYGEADGEKVRHSHIFVLARAVSYD
jgi:hypothetical protein